MTVMKKYLIVTSVFLLAGCPGPGDRMVSRTPTTTIIKDNHVCILSPLSPGEQVTAVQIHSDKGRELIKTFDDNPLYIQKGDCLPVFGYQFIAEEKYSIAYDIKTLKSKSYLITATFSIAKTGMVMNGNNKQKDSL